MKKFFMLVAACAALTFTACNSNNGGTASESMEAQEAAPVELTADNFEAQLNALVEAGDAQAVQDYIAQSQTKIDALAAEGKAEEAKTLYEKVKEVVTTQKEKIVALAPSLNDVVTNATSKVPESLKSIVTEGVDSVASATKEKAQEVVNSAVNEQVEAGKAKVAEKVAEKVEKAEEVKTKVTEKVNEGKEAVTKGKEAVNAIKNLGK